jgi:NAD(P)-dependent dehydrogenase (short-subunit alcohol dehydrogenase family)
MSEKVKVLDSFRLSGKVGIVTGASSGLGVAFATALAEAGADVAVCARREDKLTENAEKIAKATGRAVFPYVADVRNESEVVGFVAAVEKKFGRIDIVVNNAGTATVKPAVEMSGKEWLDVTDVDLNGTFYVAREAAKSMIKNKVRGSIINVASIYGIFGDVIPAASYYASKGAVVNLTRALAIEWVSYGIRVNAIAPGFFPSEMTSGVQQDQPTMQHITSRTPMGRFGRPEELAGPLVLLASDAGSYITGHILNVDGGWDAE